MGVWDTFKGALGSAFDEDEAKNAPDDRAPLKDLAVGLYRGVKAVYNSVEGDAGQQGALAGATTSAGGDVNPNHAMTQATTGKDMNTYMSPTNSAMTDDRHASLMANQKTQGQTAGAAAPDQGTEAATDETKKKGPGKGTDRWNSLMKSFADANAEAEHNQPRFLAAPNVEPRIGGGGRFNASQYMNKSAHQLAQNYSSPRWTNKLGSK